MRPMTLVGYCRLARNKHTNTIMNEIGKNGLGGTRRLEDKHDDKVAIPEGRCWEVL